MNSLEYLDEILEDKKMIKPPEMSYHDFMSCRTHMSYLRSITIKMYCYISYMDDIIKDVMLSFFGYLLYYPDHVFFDFYDAKYIIGADVTYIINSFNNDHRDPDDKIIFNPDIQHLIGSGINVVIEANDYKEHHNIIIKYFKSHLLTDDNGYSSYSYSIINNPNNIHTYDTVKLLLKHQYVTTNNDLILIKDLMKNYIYNTLIKMINFFMYFDIIKDIKTVIIYWLSQVILNEKAPIYFNIYNTIMEC